MEDESKKPGSMRPGQLIHGTYEIIRELGRGGGGVVYLARHTGMDKEMVLKAYSSKIRAKPEMVRREMQIMKDLKHAYIPTIYDFFREEDDVCTVMEYIDGSTLRDVYESKRGVIPVPDVVKWAGQLLEALDYLHRPVHGKEGKGYVHGDIKPQNIMVRENGDICLIDFNVSLALGETDMEIWCSGYASPEHYGYNYSKNPYAGVETAHGRIILPEARSDIYSLGAVLYHILSRRMPASDAKDIVPLTERDGPEPLIRIINRAIRPDPDERYQSAMEMLCDLALIRTKDFRNVRLRKQKMATAIVLAGVFIFGGASLFAGQAMRTSIAKEQAQISGAVAAVDDIKAQIAGRAKESQEIIALSRAALLRGDAEGAKLLSLQALEDNEQFVEDARLSLESVRQKYEGNNGEVFGQRDAALEQLQQFDALNADAVHALTEALGVYDLSDGFKADCAITLPGGVIKQSLSPSGRFAAILTSGQVHVVDLDSGAIAAELPANTSAYSDIVFAGDETLVYSGTDAVCAYDLKNNRELWNTGENAVGIAVSQDGMTAAIAHLNGDGAEIYDVRTGERKSSIAFGSLRQKVQTNGIFADPLDDIFALDASGRYLAVSFENGAVRVFDTTDRDGDIELLDESDYVFFEGGFFGTYFGFVASDGANSDFYVIDTAAMEMVGSLSISGEMRLSVCEDGFCLAERGVLVLLDVETGEQTELAYTQSGIQAFSHTKEYTLVQTADQKLLFFDKNAILFDRHEDIPCDFAGVAGEHAVLSGRDSPAVRLLRMENYAEHQMFSYDGTYAHDEARVSSDRSTVMLFQVDAFRLYGMDGGLLAEVSIPDPGRVYDQQYRREKAGDFLEVIYYDGLRRVYSAADGSFLSETAGERPDDSLYEEFITDRFRITSPLHGTPAVYDRDSGELIKELESEDYLAYVTPVEGGMVTEYVSSRGERYALLLDGKCNVIADLPNLCDILPDGTLVFDDMRGNLRESRIYSIQELIALGDKQ